MNQKSEGFPRSFAASEFHPGNASGLLRMPTLRNFIYIATIATSIFFGFLELKLKQQLTDSVDQSAAKIIDFGLMDELSARMRRERVLKGMPKEALQKLRLAAGLKFLFVLILVAEVIILQR
jgi:hypothetical protein